jgi:hypothetical protein
LISADAIVEELCIAAQTGHDVFFAHEHFTFVFQQIEWAGVRPDGLIECADRAGRAVLDPSGIIKFTVCPPTETGPGSGVPREVA